jgi:glycosyltransferase involved in cell wall biosynthesis
LLETPENPLSAPSGDERFRFAAVVSHPIQHFAPLFRQLAQLPGLEVRVFYCCDWGVKAYHDPGFNTTFAWDVDLLEGYNHEFLPIRRRPERLGFWEVDNPEIIPCLAAYDPHALWVHGYSHRTCWRATRWARGRTAILHFGDSELVHPRALWRRALKRLVLGRHFGRCDAFITIGDNNEKYYLHYGVPREKLFRGAYPIDLERFRSAVTVPNRPPRAVVRERFGLPTEGLVALQVGKLLESKRPLDFVEALACLARQGVAVWGLLVGDGPLRGQVEQCIARHGLQGRVRASGFINQAEMPLVLETGDILVSASASDPHPLVVSESLVMGLPVVASDRIGCIGPTDTARPDTNTLVYRCGDVEGLAEQLRLLATDVALRQRLSAGSRALAPTQDARVTAQAVVRAILHLRKSLAVQWQGIRPETFQELARALKRGT